MAEQPGLLRSMADRFPLFSADAGSLGEQRPGVLVAVARGSSAHAIEMARGAIEEAFQAPLIALDVTASARSAPKLPLNSLAIAVSQSGETPDVVAAVERLRDTGTFIRTITNEDGQLARLGTQNYAVGAGRERSIPATKSILGQVAILLSLAAAEIGRSDWPDLLRLSADWCEDELSHPRVAGAGPDNAATPIAAIGSGAGLGLAREFAQKVVETSGIPVMALDAAEFQHGPIAVVRPGVAVVGFAPEKLDVVAATLDKVAERGGATDLVAFEPVSESVASLPQGLKAGLLCLPLLVRIQQMMIDQAQSRGLNPDLAFGLTKVTPTI